MFQNKIEDMSCGKEELTERLTSSRAVTCMSCGQEKISGQFFVSVCKFFSGWWKQPWKKMSWKK